MSVSYRIGFFGFFASREILEEQEARGQPQVLNQGFNDQRVALQWIQRYAETFRGDPRHVTLSGESAGAIACWWHMKGRSENLFRRAIIQSFPPPPGGGQEIEDSQKRFDGIVAALGIPDDAPAFRKVAALQSLSAENLVSYWDGKISAPILDPLWLAASPSKHVKVGSQEYFSDFPPWIDDVIFGYNKDEVALWGASTWSGCTWEDVKGIIDTSGYTSSTQQAIYESKMYTEATSPVEALVNILTEGIWAIPSLSAAKVAAAGGKRLYFYIIEMPDPFPTPLQGYAYHSFGLPLLFYQPGPRKDEELARTMEKMSEKYIQYLYDEEPWENFGLSERYMSWNGSKTGLQGSSRRTGRDIKFDNEEDRTNFSAGCYRVLGFPSIAREDSVVHETLQ
ncbi:MAG: hypothetical protein CYPHOPRED_004022 [Cyphobasidiales sp. Tagirdzhanova-0007]|nr:MAG: hypothetical protein CYPHOPRED_004022 [Cyphobasidiales sp. Tagirdzhanova-0007]